MAFAHGSDLPCRGRYPPHTQPGRLATDQGTRGQAEATAEDLRPGRHCSLKLREGPAGNLGSPGASRRAGPRSPHRTRPACGAARSQAARGPPRPPLLPQEGAEKLRFHLSLPLLPFFSIPGRSGLHCGWPAGPHAESPLGSRSGVRGARSPRLAPSSCARRCRCHVTPGGRQGAGEAGGQETGRGLPGRPLGSGPLLRGGGRVTLAAGDRPSSAAAARLALPGRLGQPQGHLLGRGSWGATGQRSLPGCRRGLGAVF